MPRDKSDLCEHLPYQRDDMTLRVLERADIDVMLAWPRYPSAFAVFQPIFAGDDTAGNDTWYERWAADEHLLPMVVDWEDALCAGYLVLVDVDWHTGAIGNLGVRFRPDLCDRGLGTRMMELLCEWAFGRGLTCIRFDVAGPNARASRCYEKAGFVRTGEFWKDEPQLSGVDLNTPEKSHMIPHVRVANGVPQLRFFFMERQAPEEWHALG